MKKFIALSCAMLMLFTSVSTCFAQSPSEGARAGERDGKSSTSTAAWVAIGCITGGVSWIYPELMQPVPPTSGTVGKSPEYVAAYNDAYIKARKSTIQKGSCYGGLAFVVACGLYYLFVFLIFSEATDDINDAYSTTY